MTFPWQWKMKDGYPAAGVERHGLKVFSTFACGGGSTMGYKLAGYDVIGANDIDPKMERVYRLNHSPRLFVAGAVKDMLGPAELPAELYSLDVLDGSPPCSTFSFSGDREKDWGKERKFKEGQAVQALSELFFDFVALAGKLRPKVVIAENVKGMVVGNAKGYAIAVKEAFEEQGYDVQLFVLSAARMGVPQKRDRTFYVCRRRDLGMPKIALEFDEPLILLKDVAAKCSNVVGRPLSPAFKKAWARMGTDFGMFSKHDPKGGFFNTSKPNPAHVMGTIVATGASLKAHWSLPNRLSDEVLARCGTFPTDYDYDGLDPQYLVGMSVPPVMMAQVAHQVRLQLFKML